MNDEDDKRLGIAARKVLASEGSIRVITHGSVDRPASAKNMTDEERLKFLSDRKASKKS